MFSHLLLRLYFRINLMSHLTCEVWLRLFFQDRIKYQFDTTVRQRRFFRVMLSSRVVVSNKYNDALTIVLYDRLFHRSQVVGIDNIPSLGPSFLAVHDERTNDYDSEITHIYAAINIINRRVVFYRIALI